jgi:hypothetical protein
MPLDPRPRTTSPATMVRPSMMALFSTTPTAKPARSYSPNGIHVGHFRRLAADQCASRLFATLGDALDHQRSGGDVELAAGEIIEEEQRFGTLDQDSR